MAVTAENQASVDIDIVPVMATIPTPPFPAERGIR